MHIKYRRFFNLVFCFGFYVVFSSCSLYSSSDRKKFETDNAQPTSLQFENSLSSENCSTQSLRSLSPYSKVLYSYNNPQDGESVLVWGHLIGDYTIYESESLKGVFCVISDHQHN